METSAINSVSQTPPQVGEVRASTPSLRPSGEDFSQHISSQTGAAKQAATALKPEEKPAARPFSSQEAQPAVGRIRFEMDDGTRVAKYFDTKDVLIYQVPPEGTLYLIRVREESGQDTVETSA